MSEKKIIRLSQTPPEFGDTPDELAPEIFVSTLPIQHSHSYFEDDEQGLYIGVWDTDDMVEAENPYPCDEFMVIIEGSVEIKNVQSGLSETVHAGESFVIPKGYNCQWRQQGYLRKFYVISEHPDEMIPQQPSLSAIAKINSKTQQGKNFCYQDNNQRFTAGLKENFISEVPLTLNSNNTFIYLKKGSVTITESAGKEHTFRSGEAFFIPANLACSWSFTENTLQHYVEITPVKVDQNERH